MRSGAKVKIVGLQSEEGMKLNEQEGIIDHFSRVRDRYAVSLPGKTDLKMIKEANLELLKDAEAPAAVFDNEAAMMEKLKSMGMPAEMLQGLSPAQKKQMFEMTQRQGIVERAKQMATIDDEAVKELKDAGEYSWRDASDHVYMEINNTDDDAVPDMKCSIKAESIQIKAGDKVILEGNLFQKVNASESKWELQDDGKKLVVTLSKISKMRWLMVMR